MIHDFTEFQYCNDKPIPIHATRKRFQPYKKNLNIKVGDFIYDGTIGYFSRQSLNKAFTNVRHANVEKINVYMLECVDFDSDSCRRKWEVIKIIDRGLYGG